MKRDMGLVRELLLRVEAQPAMTAPLLDYEGPFFDIEGARSIRRCTSTPSADRRPVY